LKWWEFDFTRYFIWVLEKMGLAWNVVWPEPLPEEETTTQGSADDQAGSFLISTADAETAL
jgi:hypothetical protein